jgi:hypothetical protein
MVRSRRSDDRLWGDDTHVRAFYVEAPCIRTSNSSAQTITRLGIRGLTQNPGAWKCLYYAAYFLIQSTFDSWQLVEAFFNRATGTGYRYCKKYFWQGRSLFNAKNGLLISSLPKFTASVVIDNPTASRWSSPDGEQHGWSSLTSAGTAAGVYVVRFGSNLESGCRTRFFIS